MHGLVHGAKAAFTNDGFDFVALGDNAADPTGRTRGDNKGRCAVVRTDFCAGLLFALWANAVHRLSTLDLLARQQATIALVA